MIHAAIPAIRRFCLEIGCGTIVGAFVYGSVAAGSAGPSSDIDCFALLAGEVPALERAQVAARFAALQRHLGYTPDARYPIELFTTVQCQAALSGATVRDAVNAARGGFSPGALTAESDDLEVFRALVGVRLPVIDCDDLEQLTEQAWRLVGDADSLAMGGVLSNLGVKHPGDSRHSAGTHHTPYAVPSNLVREAR
jgi:nucleotidyltransferase-like protein